jgi:glycosyltransferase involved in cell wall biosynthesis
MKIVHIAKMTGVAGTENHLLTLLPGLHERGLDARLIVLAEPARPMDAYVKQMCAAGVPTEQMLIYRDVEYGLIGRLAAKLRSEQPDAVHTHLIHADWHGVIAARRAGVRRIYWSGHNDDPFRRRPAIRLIQAYLWRRVNAGIAISEAVRQFMIRVELAPPRKAITVRYGLDPAPTQPNDEERASLRRMLDIPEAATVIGSVGRLIEQKGLSYALDAFARLRQQFPSAHYVIIGDGPLRGELEARIDGLGLRGQAHLAGWHSDAARLMPAFDIFLMPSVWEGFGLVALEAMAARLPVIASKVSALPEIVVDRETGVLVPPGDVDGLCGALQRLLADAALRRAMGEAGRARLESDFSVQRMIDATLAVYRRFE